MTALTVAALAAIAIVAQDQVPLRAAPRDSAAQQAVLWQGDSLEVRGEKGDFLQVYDHRRERAGYIRATQVRIPPLQPERAAELLSVVRFLHDTPGAESLGISYAAAYLKAAPAAAIDGEVFDHLGAMAERLARRASTSRSGPEALATAAHLEVAAAYGVEMVSFERDEVMRMCYNGDAYRRVLALPSNDVQKAGAALALTRHDCVPPNLTPVERFNLDNWRAEVLERVDMRNLSPLLKARLRLRKAGVWASLAYQRARRPELGPQAVREAAGRSLDELAAVDKGALMETDAPAYSDAAIRVGASRWAVEAGLASLPAAQPRAPNKPAVVFAAGQPGETCVKLVDARHDEKNPLISRCTYGVVWQTSTALNSQGTALALAVQPLDTWRELWVFRQGATGWDVEVVPPAAVAPGLGYIEFAGWVPGKAELLTAREARVDGHYKAAFEVRRLATLAVEKQADKPANLSAFYRWQNPAWKAGTVSLR